MNAARRWGWALFWLVVAAAAAWFLSDSFRFIATREVPTGETFWGRRIWYFAHVALAIPVLLIAPVQFAATVRGRWPWLHRALGRAYLIASLLAGLFALHLGSSIAAQETQVPLTLFAAVWIGFVVVAWQAACRRRFDLHRGFVIRATAIALSFVWLRMMAAGEGALLGFIENSELRAATRGWLSFVLPLLVAEVWLSWWPAAKPLFAPRRD
ncbi:DUF2306 domain-containing protein [Sphingomonas sp. J315]|uniref:DUF2306 domain-containing protein n=1 Tax=Sphingomonas sp. J315 TaxID=2898433 RepID=UPI0021ADD94C|nr:DUF2306 domain-containing protein [Sphingomonas sp. J315]UUX99611.1 DUF2306 domain-containing protein [Sphingomonas sp. J315]UUX99640.1 DUF2306 domain-containing protein [Sphingomonas sp. J315]